MHLAGLVEEAGLLIEAAEIAEDRGSVGIVFAKFDMKNLQGAMKAVFRGVQVSGLLVEEAEVVGDSRDVDAEWRIVLLIMLDGLLPVIEGLGKVFLGVVGCADGGVNGTGEFVIGFAFLK